MDCTHAHTHTHTNTTHAHTLSRHTLTTHAHTHTHTLTTPNAVLFSQRQSYDELPGAGEPSLKPIRSHKLPGVCARACVCVSFFCSCVPVYTGILACTRVRECVCMCVCVYFVLRCTCVCVHVCVRTCVCVCVVSQVILAHNRTYTFPRIQLWSPLQTITTKIINH